MTPACSDNHHKGVRRDYPTILWSWFLVFSVALALAGCTSLDSTAGAGGAPRGSIELEVGYNSERPVKLQVPTPDVNVDVQQAVKEIDSRRKASPGSQEQSPSLPNLDQDVTKGIQGAGADKALRDFAR
jgi:hypothetical protein